LPSSDIRCFVRSIRQRVKPNSFLERPITSKEEWWAFLFSRPGFRKERHRSN
jgi:hypothetical protein